MARPFSLGVPKPLKHLCRKMGDGAAASSSELLTDPAFVDASPFPFAIEMFKALADETRPGFIAKNEIGFAQ